MELIASARMIGIGNPQISEKNAMVNVLRMVGQNMGLSKYWMKYLKPAQSPPVMPLLKS